MSDADDLKSLIASRIGLLEGEYIICPREKSRYSPCIARDGAASVVHHPVSGDICVGCQAVVYELLHLEKSKHPL